LEQYERFHTDNLERIETLERRLEFATQANVQDGKDRDALRAALEFAAGAIEDAIYRDDGLDGASGEAVLAVLREAWPELPERPRKLWDEKCQEVQALRAALRGVRAWLADDATAVTFQTLGQYRTAALSIVGGLLAALKQETQR
jgi:hypothetical protein